VAAALVGCVTAGLPSTKLRVAEFCQMSRGRSIFILLGTYYLVWCERGVQWCALCLTGRGGGRYLSSVGTSERAIGIRSSLAGQHFFSYYLTAVLLSWRVFFFTSAYRDSSAPNKVTEGFGLFESSE